MDYSLWMKKLGKVHISSLRRGSYSTLCGRPMLGNNYAPIRDLETIEDVKSPHEMCEKCMALYDSEKGEEYNSFEEKSSHGMACDFDRAMKKAVTVRNRLPKKQTKLFLKQISAKFEELEVLINDWHDTTEE